MTIRENSSEISCHVIEYLNCGHAYKEEKAGRAGVAYSRRNEVVEGPARSCDGPAHCARRQPASGGWSQLPGVLRHGGPLRATRPLVEDERACASREL